MNITRPLLLAATLSAVLGSAAVTAAPDQKRFHEPRFPVDLSVAEQHIADRFAAIDSNDDEQISAAEFMAHQPNRAQAGDQQKHRRKHRRHGGGGPDAGADAQKLTDAERAARRAEREAELFALMDTNGDGQLSASEASRDNRRAAKRTLRKQNMFARLDANGDGNISRSEFAVRIERLRAADADGDGQVTRTEARSLRQQRSGT